jgi:1-acyl-sn-glycerol-3-phosphate acyltransferase
VRFALLLAVIFRALVHYRFSRRVSIRARAEWLHQLCGKISALLGARSEIAGQIPQSGLIVSNHLSYLDVIALSAIAPVVFVSKQDVATWPLFGAAARCSGTVFVDRTRRGAVSATGEQMGQVLESGVPLVLFAEGTSSGGGTVLPFKAPLFAPATGLGSPVASCTLRYFLPEADVSEEVCYWRPEHTLAPHLLNLLSKNGLHVRIMFGPSTVRTGDRKSIAGLLHEEVSVPLR